MDERSPARYDDFDLAQGLSRTSWIEFVLLWIGSAGRFRYVLGGRRSCVVRRRRGLIWVGILLAGIGHGTVVSAESSIPWVEARGRAFEAASKSAMPVLVDVWATWCAPCKTMEQTTYQDPAVVDMVRQFVPLKVDHDRNEGFVRLYGAETLPTLLVLDDRRKELARFTGLIDSKTMLGLMGRILAGYPTYLEMRDRVGEPAAVRALAAYLTEIGNGGRAVDLLRRCRKSLKGAPAGELSQVELELAQAELADGRPGAAIKLLRRLSEQADDETIRAEAQALLARAERERGRVSSPR